MKRHHDALQIYMLSWLSGDAFSFKPDSALGNIGFEVVIFPDEPGK